MSDKLVSVCINSYNSSKYMLDTINSVINQTYKNLQIIVLDDCSTDNTVDIVKSIDDERIEIHSTYKNSVYTYAYNESLKYVKGEYVARLDADDLFTPEKIEKQVKFLEENKEYGACFTKVQVIDEDGNTGSADLQNLQKVFDFDNCTRAEMYRHFYDNSNRLCHSSSLIRTSVMKTVGDYDVTLYNVHDFDYWMRLITICPIYIIPEPLTLYRSGGASSENTSERFNALYTELVRVIYRSLNLCPDELFLKAFEDKLRLKGEHTKREVEIEKALLLLEGPLTHKGNPVLALYKFSELFKDEENVKIAREKFGFKLHDLYKFEQIRCYFDEGGYKHLTGTVNNLNAALAEKEKELEGIKENETACQKYIADLENQRQANLSHIKNLEEYVNALENNVKMLSEDIDNIKNSIYWKLTAPLRFIVRKLKRK